MGGVVVILKLINWNFRTKAELCMHLELKCDKGIIFILSYPVLCRYYPILKITKIFLITQLEVLRFKNNLYFGLDLPAARQTPDTETG